MPTVKFKLCDMLFEYDQDKNNINIQKHGISFEIAARVFFDYHRIEFFDEEHSYFEDRYDTIGSLVSINEPLGNLSSIGISFSNSNDILYVVYTERFDKTIDGQNVEITRIISARQATNFERGLYYGKS